MYLYFYHGRYIFTLERDQPMPKFSNYEFISNETAKEPKFVLQKGLSQAHWNKCYYKITHRCQLLVWNHFVALKLNLVLSKSTFSNKSEYSGCFVTRTHYQRHLVEKVGTTQSSVYFTWSLSNWIFVFNSGTPYIGKVKEACGIKLK
jgi:hypothetical protein